MQLVSGMNRGMCSHAAFMLAGEGVARFFNLLGGEFRDSGLRDGHDKPASAHERDGGWCGLNLDPAIMPAHLNRHSGLKPGLAADLSWDN